MEEQLENFLKARGIPLDSINEMKYEKIDMITIKRMEPSVLAEFIPKIGDRLAVLDFCSQTKHISSKRKDSLLEKLREKLKKKKGDAIQQTEHTATNCKPNRQIQIGWMNFEKGKYVQVRIKQGGGVRTVSVKKDYTCIDILDLGKKLFFTDGVSSKGHESQFNFSLCDFKCEKLIDPYTVEELYNLTALTRLKFYICTDKKEKPATVVLSDTAVLSDEDKIEENINREIDTAVLSDEEEIDENVNRKIDSAELSDEEEIDENIKRAIERRYCPLPTVIDSGDDDDEVTYETITVITEPDINFNINSGATQIPTQSDEQYETQELPSFAEYSSDNNQFEIQPSSSNGEERKKITLHRGKVFQELTNEFISLNVDSKIYIEIYLPNNQKENAFDGGGVFRDTLSEFWQSFYDEYTVGTASKVPILGHDFDNKRWAAVAKILAKGFLEENYFPVQLSRTFLERTIFGRVQSNLTSDLLNYMSSSEADLIKRAIKKFNHVDFEELLDCLNNYQCKWQPTKDNFNKLMEDVADKEMIQKPMFIINCWQPILKDLLPYERFEEIYNAQKNVVKNVLKNLEFENNLNAAQQNVAQYLMRYIRECDQKSINSFLRFVTGANMLIGIPIQVSFKECSSVFNRCPTAHTCNCLLMLPSNYNSYPQFRNEFEKVLNSNVWIMDMV